MPPVVRISDKNWTRLKRWAVPLEDSADDALGKALDAAETVGDSIASGNQPPDSSHLIASLVASTRNEEMDTIVSDTDKSDSATGAKRLPRGKRVPQSTYEKPILESLYEFGGRALGREVLTKVEQKIGHLLGDVEYELVGNGSETRWRNTAYFARQVLVERGSLKPTAESGRGTWELTEQGSVEAKILANRTDKTV